MMLPMIPPHRIRQYSSQLFRQECDHIVLSQKRDLQWEIMEVADAIGRSQPVLHATKYIDLAMSVVEKEEEEEDAGRVDDDDVADDKVRHNAEVTRSRRRRDDFFFDFFGDDEGDEEEDPADARIQSLSHRHLTERRNQPKQHQQSVLPEVEKVTTTTMKITYFVTFSVSYSLPVIHFTVMNATSGQPLYDNEQLSALGLFPTLNLGGVDSIHGGGDTIFSSGIPSS